MQKSAKIALIAVFVVVIGGGLGFYLLVLKGDAPPPPKLDLTTAGSTPAGGTVPASADGTWKLTSDPANFAGYFIKEVFAGEAITKDARGRTPSVTGSFSLKGTTIDKADFTVDMTTLKSDRSPRDGFMRRSGLETDTFKTATFTLTEPITLPSAPALNTQFDVKAKGNITIHGVTKPATFTFQAGWTGAEIKVVGTAPIVLADFGITQLQMGPATIQDHGEVEVDLRFAQG